MPSLLCLAGAAVLTAFRGTEVAVAGPQEDEDFAGRLLERCTPAVWLVEAKDAEPAKAVNAANAVRPTGEYRPVRLGTAFVWRREEGLLLTSATLVGTASKVALVQPGRRIEADVAALDAETDIALLRTDAKSLAAWLPLGESASARPGYHAYIVGPEMVPLRFADGRINHAGYRLAGYGEPLMVVNASVDVAAAGSPVLGTGGKVIGMVHATGTGQRAVGLAWARSGQKVQHVIGRAARAERRGGAGGNDPAELHWVLPLNDELRLELLPAGNQLDVVRVTPDGTRQTGGRLVALPAGTPASGTGSTVVKQQADIPPAPPPQQRADPRVPRNNDAGDEPDDLRPSPKPPAPSPGKPPAPSSGPSGSGANPGTGAGSAAPATGNESPPNESSAPDPRTSAGKSTAAREPAPARDNRTADWMDVGFGSAPTTALGAAKGPPTFAIPVDLLRSTAEDLLAHGRVPRGQIGVVVRDSETPAGAVVHWVLPGGPAEKAGIAKGDVLLGVDGRSAADATELLRLLRACREGRQAVLSVHATDGPARSVKVTPAALRVGLEAAAAQGRTEK